MTKAKSVEQLIKRPWTRDEDEVLRSRYAEIDDVAAIVPGRTKHAIVGRANVLGLHRPPSRPHPGKIVSPVFVRDGVEGKACVKCLEWKPLVKFGRHSTCVGGRRNTCTTCEGRQSRAHTKADPVKYERMKANVRAYQARNPLRMRILCLKRRCRMAGGRGVTLEQYRELLELYDYRCAYCGSSKNLTMDHFVPLSRGGEHDIDNILPACWHCNSSKHTLTGFEFYERERQRAQKA